MFSTFYIFGVKIFDIYIVQDTGSPLKVIIVWHNMYIILCRDHIGIYDLACDIRSY